MDRICVYTCITGDYDSVNEIQNKEKGIDYYLFTNNKDIHSKTWNVVLIEDKTLDNHRLSRKIKMLGHPMINNKYDIFVWMDASIVWKSSIKDFVNKFLKNNSFAAFKHSQRNCIYEESHECLRLRKDTKDNITKHIAFLRQENYPEQFGLCEMTVFIRKKDPIVEKTMKLWFDMVCNYSKRDQLSFMYAVWKTGLKIDLIEENVWKNDYFSFVKHNFAEIIKNARIYFGNENIDYNLDLDYIVDYKENNNTYSFKVKIPVNTNQIKIDVTNVPCLKYSNIKIEGVSIDNIQPLNSIQFKKDNIFFNEYSGLLLEGNFIKNKTLSFSIHLEKLSWNERQELIEQNCYDVLYYKKEYEQLLRKNITPKRNLVRRTLSFSKRTAKKIIHKIKKNPNRVKVITDNSKKIETINQKIAIQVHVFYTDLLNEIYENIKNMPYDFDLLITTDTIEKKAKIEDYFKKKKTKCKEVKVVSNRGRDILPFIRQLKNRIKEYDIVCHLHTKKSKYSDFGNQWRKYLYKNLLGSENNIKSIFYEFQKKKIGLIYPEIYPEIKEKMLIGGNQHLMDELCKRLNINNSFQNRFPAGSMFWVKREVIEDIIENVKVSDFAEEEGQMDGTMAHAIERILEVAAQEKKYKAIQIRNETK